MGPLDIEEKEERDLSWSDIRKGIGTGLNVLDKTFEFIDDQVGIPGTDIDVQHARDLITDPLDKIHPVAGLVGEILVPDSTDLLAGSGYVKRAVKNVPEITRALRKTNLNKMLGDVFDTRIPNPFKVGEFASSTGTGFGPRGINPPDGSVNLGPSGKPLRNTGGNPYLTYAERKGISPVPSKKELIRREKLGSDWQNIDNSTLDPSQVRDWTKYERDEAAYFLENRWPRDKEFNELGDLIKKQLEKLYPDIPLSSWRRHHTNPLKQGAQLLNGLKPQFRKEAVQIMFGEGLSAGHNPKQLAVIPHKIHVQIHNFLNQRIGKDTVALLETKWLKPGQKIEDIPWPERREIIMEYAQIVKESNEKIYDMMTAIAVNKKHGPNVLPEVLAKLNSKVDATDVGLDDLLKEIKLELNYIKLEILIKPD